MENAISDVLSHFLRANQAGILAEWEDAVRQIPVARELSRPALLDHIPHLLDRIATLADRLAAGEHAEIPRQDAEEHALARLDEGFDLREVVTELSTLRTCILHTWERDSATAARPTGLHVLNAAIDQAIKASVERYVFARDRTLQALDRISVAAFESRDLPELLQRLLGVLIETTAAVDTGLILLREGDRFVAKAAVGLEEGVVDRFSVAIGEGLAGRVALEKKAILVRCASTEPDLRSDVLRTKGVRALYAIPLVERGEVIGVAKMGSLTAYDFSEQDQRMFNALGSRATAAIYQQMLRDTADRQARELETERSRMRDVLMNAPAAVAVVRGPTYVYELSNPQNNRYLGRDPTGLAVAEAFPQASARGLLEILDRVYGTGEPFFGKEVPIGVADPDGTPREIFVDFVYQPVIGGDGTPEGVAVFAFDVTPSVLARKHQDEVRRSRDQLQVVLGGVSEGIVAVGPDHRLVFANESAARTAGFASVQEMMEVGYADARHEVRGEDGQVLPADERPGAVAIATGKPARRVVSSRLLGGGEEHWWDVAATPVFGVDGKPVMAIVIWHDITEVRREDERQRYLANATAILAESLDPEETLRKVAHLAVPRIADWCVVDLVTGDHDRRRVAVAHVDVEKAQLLEAFQNEYRTDPEASYGVAKVFRTGMPEMIPHIEDDLLARVARDAEHLRRLRELGMCSAMIVPMESRGKVVGAITFVSAESARHYGQRDLAFAQELGRRSANAVENAALFDETRAANQTKDDFLAMLAHELRNPLAPMMNATTLLLQGAASRLPVEVLDRQVRHMSRMVDDLLEVSRITRGKIDLKRTRVDLVEIVRHIAADRAPSAREANVSLSLELPAEPVRVFGDETRLAQAVTNLVTNAIKFTEAGGSIKLRVREVEGSAEVSILDTGIGIHEDTLQSIFEAFTQADRTLDRSRGGLGLGLAIVRGLVELHGGHVTAHSEGPGRGAEFRMVLPLDRTSAHIAARNAAASTSAPRRILVVEDNRDAADMLAELLRNEGHAVTVCYSGDGALVEALRVGPEVVLCDIGLPGKDGFTVARELRGRPETAKVTLIAMTGYGAESDRVRSREAGFDIHLTKPVDPAHLKYVLAGLSPGLLPAT